MAKHSDIGNQARIDGLAAEAMVKDQLVDAGWQVVTSPTLDYANKVDAYAICPVGNEFPLQISLHPKSRRQEQALEARGVFPLPTSRLADDTASGFVCSSLCSRDACEVYAPDQEAQLVELDFPRFPYST